MHEECRIQKNSKNSVDGLHKRSLNPEILNEAR